MRLNVLTNFYDENLKDHNTLDSEMDVEKSNYNYNVFSVLTYRDLVFNFERSKTVFLYHSSTTRMYDAIGSPLHYLTQFKDKMDITESKKFMKKVMDFSTHYCEKLIVSDEEIPSLKMFKIHPIKMSEESFNELMNMNSKNVQPCLMNILKTIILAYPRTKGNCQYLLNKFKEFMDVRYDALYRHKNENMYATRYYIQNFTKRTHNTIAAVEALNYMKTFVKDQPVNNTILPMFWDTMFIFPIFQSCQKYLLQKLSPQFRSKIIMNRDDLLEKGEYIKQFRSAIDFSYRNFNFNINDKILNPDDKENPFNINSFYISGDFVNSMDKNSVFVKYNEECLRRRIDTLLKLFK